MKYPRCAIRGAMLRFPLKGARPLAGETPAAAGLACSAAVGTERFHGAWVARRAMETGMTRRPVAIRCLPWAA